MILVPLLIFTDGLTDSIQGEHPENRLCDAFAVSSGQMMANLRSLVDPKFNEDDVTILLVKRTPEFCSYRRVCKRTINPEAKS